MNADILVQMGELIDLLEKEISREEDDLIKEQIIKTRNKLVEDLRIFYRLISKQRAN